jgi:hypothetical protein
LSHKHTRLLGHGYFFRRLGPLRRFASTHDDAHAGGLYIKYTNVPLWYRWICYINPYFYTIMGLVKIEFENYKYPNHQVSLSKYVTPRRSPNCRFPETP